MMDFRGAFFRNSEKNSRRYLTEEVRENYNEKAVITPDNWLECVL